MLENLESLETPVHSAEKKIVLKAISDSDGKISVADIATKTSLPVLTASSLLNQIAYETGGHLTVGSQGSIVYEFDRNFQNSYLTRGSRNFFLRMWRITANTSLYLARLFTLLMFFLIRISFGIILVLSVVLIVVLVVVVVVALLAKLMGNDNDSGPDIDFGGIFGGIGGVFRYWAFDWLWDWWYWGRYIRWEPAPSYREIPNRDYEQLPQQSKDKESFLDKCFSFLFGDGDPNLGLEERRWQNIALLLKANNGVVVAEQLAPFVDVKGRNEDWVLPILVRFNGTCDVTDSGNIIYSFPSFQQQKLESTEHLTVPADAKSDSEEQLHDLFRKHIANQKASQTRQTAIAHLQPYLKEQEWQLTHVSGGARTTIIAFALFILIGSIWLTTMVIAMPFLLPLVPLLGLIAAYGAMFFLIPGIRWLLIQQKNKAIESRNSQRYTAYNKLTNPDKELLNKLSECDQSRHRVIQETSAETITYTTDREYLEQQFDDISKPGD